MSHEHPTGDAPVTMPGTEPIPEGQAQAEPARRKRKKREKAEPAPEAAAEEPKKRARFLPGLKKETRAGIAIVLSFCVIVAVLIANRNRPVPDTLRKAEKQAETWVKDEAKQIRKNLGQAGQPAPRQPVKQPESRPAALPPLAAIGQPPAAEPMSPPPAPEPVVPSSTDNLPPPSQLLMTSNDQGGNTVPPDANTSPPPPAEIPPASAPPPAAESVPPPAAVSLPVASEPEPASEPPAAAVPPPANIARNTYAEPGKRAIASEPPSHGAGIPMPALTGGHERGAPSRARPEPSAPDPGGSPRQIASLAPTETPAAFPPPAEPASPPGQLSPEIKPTALPPQPDGRNLVEIPNVPRSRRSATDDPPRTLAMNATPERGLSNGPEPAEAVGEAIEPQHHVVQRGENFWTISKVYYNSGRYWKALWAFNRDRAARPEDLVVGTPILVPPFEMLDRTLVDPSAGASAPVASRPAPRRTPQPPIQSTATGARAQPKNTSEIELALPVGSPTAVPDRLSGPSSEGLALSREEQRYPRYRVKNHETLRSIARDTLGDSRRADEIFEMNKDLIADPRRLVPDQVLLLPEDARVPKKLR